MRLRLFYIICFAIISFGITDLLMPKIGAQTAAYTVTCSIPRPSSAELADLVTRLHDIYIHDERNTQASVTVVSSGTLSTFTINLRTTDLTPRPQKLFEVTSTAKGYLTWLGQSNYYPGLRVLTASAK